jgi:hypothetical protein
MLLSAADTTEERGAAAFDGQVFDFSSIQDCSRE